MKSGHHLILDLKNCEKVELLSDKSFIEDFLVKLVSFADVKIIGGPFVFYYENEIREESGVTAVVIISDSHISIHTYPFKKALYLDFFSCIEFNDEKVVDFVKGTFKSEKVISKVLKR